MLRSKVAAGTRCALEHGGAAPVIVAADADLDYALPLLIKGGLYHAGQVCVSVQRVFAHESLVQELSDRLADSARTLKVGDPTHPETDVGPLIRPSETDRVEAWVEEAVQAGAKLLAGGKRISDFCYECTVPSGSPRRCQSQPTGNLWSRDLRLFVHRHRPGHPPGQRSALRLSGLRFYKRYRYGDARLFTAESLCGDDQRSQCFSSRLDAVCRIGAIGPGGGGYSLHNERHANRKAYAAEIPTVVKAELTLYSGDTFFNWAGRRTTGTCSMPPDGSSRCVGPRGRRIAATW